MAKKKKLYPGVGAKCSILTRLIHPRVKVEDRNHRTAVVLISKKQMIINRSSAECFVFKCLDGPAASKECYAVKKHLVVTEEGSRLEFFDQNDVKASEKQEIASHFVEPKISWRLSKAKQRLHQAIIDGRIPENATSHNGNIIMGIEEIYEMDEEFAKYSYEKFADRLARVRSEIQRSKNRAAEDLIAFENFCSNHKVSLFSRKGYIQWQGCNAQRLLSEDMNNGKHTTMKPKELWESRPEYYESFPLDAFRSKIEQEIQTSKYLHTMRVKGVSHNAS